MNGLQDLPLPILTDSYKTTHSLMYPQCQKLVCYGEFRQPYTGYEDDNRVLAYGIRYLVQKYLEKQWTMEEVEKADVFFKTHNAGYTQFPFPRQLFVDFIQENNGYFPIKLEAVPEGTAMHNHVPIYQITAEGKYSSLVTYFETLLTQVWYPTTVATLSRRTKDIIFSSFEKSVDEELHFLVNIALHDFGFRGCTCLEQSVIGGSSHLLNFEGSDTLAACYHVQFNLNNGKPIGKSVPASEHSVMTSWRSEKEAIENIINQYGEGTYSIVLDSYDYSNCLDNIIPSLADKKREKGGMMVFRPDSGDPVSAVMEGLRAAEKAFGAEKNKKGFKVLNKAAVLQGDGIDSKAVERILEAAMKEGFSAVNLVFGMGGGLLQKVNRDTMSFATKVSQITYPDGEVRDIMKKPKTDPTKVSLPGVLAVKSVNGIPTVYPAENVEASENMLKVVYDHKPVAGVWDYTFDSVRERVEKEWPILPKAHDPISKELRQKIDNWTPNLST